MKIESKWDGEYLCPSEIVAYWPLMQECRQLEKSLCNGGALHIVIEDGNHEHSNVQWCIDYIESGKYEKECRKHGLMGEFEFKDRQLAFAKAIVGLPEQHIEMICNQTSITERLFDHLYNEPETVEITAILPEYQLQKGQFTLVSGH